MEALAHTTHEVFNQTPPLAAADFDQPPYAVTRYTYDVTGRLLTVQDHAKVQNGLTPNCSNAGVNWAALKCLSAASLPTKIRRH